MALLLIDTTPATATVTEDDDAHDNNDIKEIDDIVFLNYNFVFVVVVLFSVHQKIDAISSTTTITTNTTIAQYYYTIKMHQYLTIAYR